MVIGKSNNPEVYFTETTSFRIISLLPGKSLSAEDDKMKIAQQL
jgi:hypothetical protein